jgi:hypothetical protein
MLNWLKTQSSYLISCFFIKKNRYKYQIVVKTNGYRYIQRFDREFELFSYLTKKGKWDIRRPYSVFEDNDRLYNSRRFAISQLKSKIGDKEFQEIKGL